MFEAMREAERDAALRERMGAMLTQYRELMIQAIRAEQNRGTVFTRAPADAIATLLGAVGDGLLLHALLDPELDVAAALDALRLARSAAVLAHLGAQRHTAAAAQIALCHHCGRRGRASPGFHFSRASPERCRAPASRTP